ncbi:glycosyltransferase family 2 protein [Faecalimonas umbilicata]|uniref:glycosyltransferase family 2 protein n=1 Tax=Faecalimonas umbilicata TaxID=1912855 RepID=UPI000E423491|nr:glycosyltransferase family 2 protein [Faecalimonas umbilicata]RGC78448.1 glycosyltransferase family 2 protein [Lachnospiraceae bacterium AM25-17]RJU66785.1 glycosyltransferase family 2 protein [Coprococcus sp. AM27-12LB]
MSEKETKTFKIKWTKVLKKVSPYNIKKGILYLRHYGPKEFWVKLTERFQADDVDYEQWYENHKALPEELEKQKNEKWKRKPLISIVVPVYNTPQVFLRQMIESVQNQSYSEWELCIGNASPENKEMKKILEEYKKDARIKEVEIPENKGISQNTNRAMEIASGELIGLLDHDDLLAPNALYEIAKAVNEHPDPEVIYTDEDKVTTDLKEHFQPHLKPDFNLDLLRSNNYICHFFVASRDLIKRVGGFRPEFNGAQDYDLILRCTEQAKQIVHIPKILYHWRVHKASTADNPASKMYAFDAGKRAIEEHLVRCRTKGTVQHTKDLGFYRVKYEICGEPLVSIIIPNKDQSEALKKCLDSIREKTSYRNYEIIIVENNSEEPETFAFYKKIAGEKIKVVTWEGEFNYSAINNFGVRHARGDYLLLLNNDVEIINGDWLTEMLSHCQRKEVGIVGAKLYYPDNTIQHAGIIIGIGGVAGSVFVGLPRAFSGYLHKASIQLDLSAVTAACMLVKRSVFEQVGGLEEKLKVAFNDVDFCLRVREKGYLVVYDPYAELYHYESKTRGAEDTKEKIRRFQTEIEYMRSHWIGLLKKGDPYYNCNLSLTKWDYSLKNNQRS